MKKMFLILVTSCALGSLTAVGQIATMSATDKEKVETKTTATAEPKGDATDQAKCADKTSSEALIAAEAKEWERAVHNQ